MQDIRRATRKHRKLLLAVVILLLVGLVGSFATWNSAGQSVGSGGEDGEYTLEQQITAYENYVDSLKKEHNGADYSGSLTLASAYVQLSYLYGEKYSNESANAPSLPSPEYDENGEEIPLTPEQAAALETATAERESALAAAAAWQEAGVAAAQQAESYYQQALDNVPDGLNDAGIAEIKVGQASAREAQSDLDGALAFMREAYELAPDNVNYLMALASLEQTLGNLEGALAWYEQAAVLYPDSAYLMAAQASLHSDLGNYEQAQELYQQARTMAPEDFDIAYSYAAFIFFSDSPEAGIAELTAYRDALPEGHANIEQANNGIANLQGWADLFAGLGQGSAEGTDGEGTEDGNTGENGE